MDIRKYRLLANMTQQELATKVNVSKSMISQLENNLKEPSVKLLVHMSVILEVCICSLLDIECSCNL